MPDLVVSLGPNCRAAWNIRHHFNLATAFPFDWLICPTASMLTMISPRLELAVHWDDLAVVSHDGDMLDAFPDYSERDARPLSWTEPSHVFHKAYQAAGLP